MTKKYLKIRPLDTLFFRTGKPFPGGEVSWTESSLLPNPSVLWGAIYSMLMTHDIVNCKKVKSKKSNERKTELEKLKLGRIFLYDGNEGVNRLYLPVPLDTYYEKEEEEKTGVFKLVKSKNNYLSLSNYQGNAQYELVFHNKEASIESFKDAVIDTISFSGRSYLYQNNGNLAVQPLSHLIEKSHKVGIKRDNQSHTAEESMLYRINSSQLKEHVYFIVEIEVEDKENCFPYKGLLKLGGEGRGASYELFTKEHKIHKITTKIHQPFDEKFNYLRLYLYSSTFFDTGTGIEELKEAGFEVLAACLGKAQTIGGFDVLKNEPKAMQKAVPAGSVYFLKTEKDISHQTATSKLKDVLKSCHKGFGLFEIFPLTIKDE